MNLLRGEFYKLFKGKAFYVCCFVGIFLVIFVYFTLFFATSMEREGVTSSQIGVVNAGEENMPKSNVPAFEEITTLEYLQQMFGNFGSFVTVIFAAIFVIGEYGNGAVKNVVGKGYKRWQIFGAKYVATVVAGILQLLLMGVITVITGKVMQNIAGASEVWNKEFFTELSVYTGIQLLFGAALIGVSIAISEMCRHLGAGIAISFGIVGFSALITGGLDYFIQFLFPGTTFRLADYWLIDLIAKCPLKNIDGKFLAHGVLVALMWIIVTFGAGIWHFKKADIQ